MNLECMAVKKNQIETLKMEKKKVPKVKTRSMAQTLDSRSVTV